MKLDSFSGGTHFVILIPFNNDFDPVGDRFMFTVDDTYNYHRLLSYYQLLRIVCSLAA